MPDDFCLFATNAIAAITAIEKDLSIFLTKIEHLVDDPGGGPLWQLEAF